MSVLRRSDLISITTMIEIHCPTVRPLTVFTTSERYLGVSERFSAYHATFAFVHIVGGEELHEVVEEIVGARVVVLLSWCALFHHAADIRDKTPARWLV